MARSRESKIELTAYDDLFETDESRAEFVVGKNALALCGGFHGTDGVGYLCVEYFNPLPVGTQPHYLSAKGLELLLRSVSKVKRQINPHLRIDGILMSSALRCPQAAPCPRPLRP